MNKKRMIDIIQAGENTSVDFKAGFDKETIATLTAFANTNGGSVLLGVGNSGEIKGIKIGKETFQNWLNSIKLASAPSLFPESKTISSKRMSKLPMVVICYLLLQKPCLVQLISDVLPVKQLLKTALP